MSRITPVNPEDAQGKAKQLLTAVKNSLGVTPTMMRAMAQSPAVLGGYLQFSAALGTGSLTAKVREQIALAVAQANSCEYCLSAHTALGASAGLTAGEVSASRLALSDDPKTDALLKFVRTIVTQNGQVRDADFDRVRDAGFSEGEIAEIVANVAINIFTNYFNLVAGTEIDFPRVAVALA